MAFCEGASGSGEREDLVLLFCYVTACDGIVVWHSTQVLSYHRKGNFLRVRSRWLYCANALPAAFTRLSHRGARMPIFPLRPLPLRHYPRNFLHLVRLLSRRLDCVLHAIASRMASSQVRS